MLNMTFDDLQKMANRAFVLTFDKKKLLPTFFVLLFCGFVLIFFQKLAHFSGDWIRLTLSFLPIYFCFGLCFALGVFITRIWHNEVKERKISLKNVLVKSWDELLAAFYFALPVMAVYLVGWLILGGAFLLDSLPFLGTVIGSFLSFVPFLLNLMFLLLLVMCLVGIFFMTPIVALKGRYSILEMKKMVQEKIQFNPFLNGLCLFFSLFPLFFSVLILSCALWMTHWTSSFVLGFFQEYFSAIFIMIPFVAFLSPSVTFFFLFSAEFFIAGRRPIS